MNTTRTRLAAQASHYTPSGELCVRLQIAIVKNDRLLPGERFIVRAGGWPRLRACTNDEGIFDGHILCQDVADRIQFMIETEFGCSTHELNYKGCPLDLGKVQRDMALTPGLYIVNSPIIVAKGASLTLTEGTTLQFSPGTGIHSHGALSFNGKNHQQIILRAFSDEWNGIAVEGEEASASLHFCTIRDARNEHGGGLRVMSTKRNTLVTDTLFTQNRALNGGALSVRDSVVTLHQCRLANNQSQNSGGAVHLYKGKLSLTSSDVTQNSTGGNGGGLWVSESNLFLKDIRVQDNRAQFWGGGLRMKDSDVEIIDSIMNGNDHKQGPAKRPHNSDILSITGPDPNIVRSDIGSRHRWKFSGN